MRSEKKTEKRRETAMQLRRIDPTGDVRAAMEQYEKRKTKNTVCILGAALLLAAAAFFLPGESLLSEGLILHRNAAGDGNYSVTLIASVLSGFRFETEVTVAEQALSGDEAAELFDAAEDELMLRMLGDNESTDYIVTDLELPSETLDGLVEAQWAFDSYEVISSDGSICDDVPDTGQIVEVTLTMSYLEQTSECVFSICVWPPEMSEEEELMLALEEAVAAADENTAEEEIMVLPDEVNGETVSWSEPKDYLWLKIFLIGVFAAVVMRYEEKEKINRAMNRRDEQMMEDYAGIVNKLSLLLSAGMTLYGAWGKIVDTYVAEQDESAGKDRSGNSRKPGGRDKRIAYEEMKVTYAQLREGVGEARAYEEFGRRCGLRPYLKLSTILTQNLKLGTASVTGQLTAEAQEAFEQRKVLARTKGEEAGTKLMMPMMMLLVVVMAIVVIPGFMSF